MNSRNFNVLSIYINPHKSLYDPSTLRRYGAGRGISKERKLKLLTTNIRRSNNIKDNDGVISFLTSQDQIDYIVIRPLFLLSHFSFSSLKSSSKVGGVVTFAEVGKFTIDAVQNNNLVGTFPYVSR